MIEGVTDARGGVRVLAIDHRDAMRRFLAPDAPASVDPTAITALKIEVVAALADLATAVMLEPEYSIPQVIDAGVVPSGVGVIAALEAQGYHDDPAAAPTRILAGWSPEQARQAGAAMVKLLLPYRPDASFAGAQEDVAREVLALSTAAAVPLVLEPYLWGVTSPEEHAAVVVATAERFAPLGPALLKLPFPGEGRADRRTASDACRRITERCAMPWAVLSGGGTFDPFLEQVTIAVDNGCAGFMVGRALWGDAVRAPAAERGRLLRDVVRPRLSRLNDVVGPPLWLAPSASPHRLGASDPDGTSTFRGRMGR